MSQPDAASASRFEFECIRCHRPIRAGPELAGREVRCPHCSSPQRAPEVGPDGVIGRARPPAFGPKRFFNFVCGRCRCVLEAHDGMCGQTGHCPTCDALFVIPQLDPVTGLPLHDAEPTGERQAPTPIHAYAASGGQAPQIVKSDDGALHIQCPKCDGLNPIDANRCSSCGAPFTLEGAAQAVGGRTRDRAAAACTLGLIALVASVFFLPGICAVLLGWYSLREAPPGAKPPAAVAGVALGIVSIPLGVLLLVLLLT